MYKDAGKPRFFMKDEGSIVFALYNSTSHEDCWENITQFFFTKVLGLVIIVLENY